MAEEKKVKENGEKKPNFFVRIGKKIGKFFKDVVGEMKKVTWTSPKLNFVLQRILSGV